ncbi:MAG: cob(I)yrinic acid a,c-diamide adenosyltransferase [Paramuribaculum sp.]|nr:cob(I)yrinic acid a,c-diamide adenosyltransferase [Paramuribaculum sp.]
MSVPKSILYTGTGDHGSTSLVSGHRISKHDVRIEAYGTVDELNSHIGLVVSLPGLPEESKRMLLWVQNKLFDLGAYLANDMPGVASGVDDDDILRLESMIDVVDNKLPALRRFVLPGGCVEAGQLQVARAVCRRAERRMLSLGEEADLASEVLVFVNRLSDFLFALGRYANICNSVDEIFWDKNC